MKIQLIATAFLVALSSITLLPQSTISQQFNPENIVLTYPVKVVNSTHGNATQCPSQETLQDVRSEITQDIRLLLNELIAGEPTSDQCANCSACCGQSGEVIFEADLTTGASFTAAGSGISLSSQFVGSGMCAKQGVATITFPQPLSGQPQRRLLRFDLFFNVSLINKSSSFNFDIGDSLTDGWGGDGGQTSNAAEVHSLRTNWLVYSNTLPGYLSYITTAPLNVDNVPNAITEHVTVTIGDEYVEFDNHAGFQRCYRSRYLFTLSGQTPTYGSVNYDIFFSMNRVVSTASRSGVGLCRAIIKAVDCDY